MESEGMSHMDIGTSAFQEEKIGCAKAQIRGTLADVWRTAKGPESLKLNQQRRGNKQRIQRDKREPDHAGSYEWMRVKMLAFTPSKMRSHWRIPSR